ncbi:uncharacterized protein SCHCODRAFT_01349130 [Schizophyllum commune H4-8]|uniref:Uncharacterized protein n=1 Tax=Schizophyllum commune (strain H4-8 / FGSC 9210) TaxID=578458 RepID=D8Q1D3_SCHCM|nr:uncharacterized protein SCHCODRAFT_01349130 [Schizophyllum commune H4-8]KAI5895372.1 hypothetical protein SCHCODRAFT_01349130 [Schizophyllum commune H4-8]
MDVGEETWLECMQLGPPYSVDRVLSDEGAHPEPPYNWPAGPLFDQLQLANLFKPTCKPTARCRTVSDTTFTTDSSADPDILLSASAVTASPHTFDILAGACPQPPTYPPGHPATWAPSPDVALTGQPPSSTSLHFDLDTTSKPLNSPYVALDDASSLQANFRREVGSQAQTEASIKRRRASARSSSAYVCECCPKTFTRKKNLQEARQDRPHPASSIKPKVPVHPFDNPFSRYNEPPLFSTSAIDKERALLNVDTSVEPIPVTHAPAHIVAPFTLRGLLQRYRCHRRASFSGHKPSFRLAPTGTTDALPNQYTPSSPYKSARINADSHKHLHEPVLPANSAPETVPNPGMLIVATETSPSPGGATSASCLPPPTNNFRKRVSTRNRQQASEKRRSSGSRSNFSCNIEGCTTTFTRWQNLKASLRASWLQATLQHARASQKPRSACARRSVATKEDSDLNA